MGNKQQNRARIVLAILILLLLAGTTWAVRGARAKTVQMSSEAKALLAQMTDENAKREERGEAFKKMRELPKDQRDELEKQLRERWTKREQDKLDHFFTLTPEQQQAELDKEIERMQERSKRWEERRKSAEGKQGGSNGASNGDAGGQGKSGAASGSDGSSSKQGPSLDQRDAMRREMLNHTTPEQRAQMSNYRMMLQQRAQQLGVPMPSGRGGPGGGGPPGGGRRGP
jgi:multidrug efflux pump subunit AcrB